MIGKPSKTPSQVAHDWQGHFATVATSLEIVCEDTAKKDGDAYDFYVVHQIPNAAVLTLTRPMPPTAIFCKISRWSLASPVFRK